jgi:aerobic-type carbon monoxide dehydrogenase small subunit (CoxS/CutS family)
VPACDGQTVAAALLASGRRVLRRTATGAPRGVFCGMGVCFDCLVTVDGQADRRACITPARPGMRVGLGTAERGHDGGD